MKLTNFETASRKEVLGKINGLLKDFIYGDETRDLIELSGTEITDLENLGDDALKNILKSLEDKLFNY